MKKILSMLVAISASVLACTPPPVEKEPQKPEAITLSEESISFHPLRNIP